MKYINLAIVAHVDAGKTSLTENILFHTKTIKRIGNVDKGNTQTDSLKIEKQRGITIKSSPISFYLEDIKVNLIDTPGHADFISEVERSLAILDGAVLVISGVEGVQAQTKIILNALIKLKIPTIIFINKLDRIGADYEKVIQSLKELISQGLVCLYYPEGQGGNEIKVKKRENLNFENELINTLSLKNDKFISEFVEKGALTTQRIQNEFIDQVKLSEIFPIILGSAAKSIGVSELLHAIVTFFPKNESGDKNILSGLIFKKENVSINDKNKCYFRLFFGHIAQGDLVKVTNILSNSTKQLKIKKLSKLESGKLVQTSFIEGGDIGVIHDTDLSMGDILGEHTSLIKNINFTQPNLEASIKAVNSIDDNKLFNTLNLLSNEDPNIQLSLDYNSKTIKIRLFGEIQKEFIQHTLEVDYEIPVEFGETNVVYIEKPIGKGIYIEEIGKKENPFLATIGLKVEPFETDNTLIYKVKTEKGALPQSFYNAIEESVRITLEQGLYGWEVKGIKVTLIQVGYISPDSTAADFRNLTPIVLMNALNKAKTIVYEPINEFNLHVNSNHLDKVFSFLLKVRAEIHDHSSKNDHVLLKGTIPVVELKNVFMTIKHITEGEGIFVSEPHAFKEIISEDSFPIKERKGFSPLNKLEYLLSITKGLKVKNE